MPYIEKSGTEGDDVLVGEDGNSYRFYGYAGNDTLTGADGNDDFDGGAGDDVMSGGAGDDRFQYRNGETPVGDTLDGGDGFDDIIFFTSAGESLGLLIDDAMRTNIEQVTGLDGNESFYGWDLTSGITLSGEGGNDYLEGGHGGDILTGGADADTLIGNGGDDFLFGGDGNDRIIYKNGQSSLGDVIDGGDGTDTVKINSEAGTTFSMTVLATTFHSIEELLGGLGDDHLDASAISSGIAIAGGGGNDVLAGGAGDDNVAGDDGDDTLAGGMGNDTLDGGAGADVMHGGDGDDMFVYSGSGPDGDTLDGGAGFDTLFLATAAGSNLELLLDDAMRTNIEQFNGMDGNEYFNGRDLTSDIILSGQAGDDYLVGGHGNDTLLGGAGRDFLTGNGGSDLLIGGAGDDIFVVRGSGGTWNVADFRQGEDHIWIDSGVPLDFTYVMQHAEQVGDDTQININGSVMILRHIGLASLTEADFFF